MGEGCNGPHAEMKATVEPVMERMLLYKLAESHNCSRERIAALEGMLDEHWLNERGNVAREGVERGVELMLQSKFDAAKTAFAAICKQYPSWAEAWYKRSEVAFFAKEYERSKECCVRALHHKPYHFRALAGLVNTYLVLDQAAEAISTLNGLWEVHPNYASRLQKRFDHVSKTDVRLLRMVRCKVKPLRRKPRSREGGFQGAC